LVVGKSELRARGAQFLFWSFSLELSLMSQFWRFSV
jgi:hypothetical protein